MKFKPIVLLCLVETIFLSGCAQPGINGSDYTYSEVRGEQMVRLGTIESIRMVRIQSGQPSIAGGIIGGVTGAMLGGLVGQGETGGLATMAGAVAGGLAGSSIETQASQQNGMELTIRYDSGQLVSITQGVNPNFQIGARVQVIGGGPDTRVMLLARQSPLNQMNSMPPVPPQGSAPAGDGPIRYFCRDNKKFYPEVPTCPSPWIRTTQ